MFVNLTADLFPKSGQKLSSVMTTVYMAFAKLCWDYRPE